MTPDPDELVILLTQGIGQRKMYFSEHPKVVAVCRSFPLKLGAFLKTEKKKSFFLGIVEGKLVHNGRYLIGPTIVGKKLSEFAEILHCGGFLFQSVVHSDEMKSLFSLAAELAEPLAHLEEARSLIRDRGIKNIELSPVYEDPEHFGKPDDLDSLLADDDGGQMGGMFLCQGLFEAVDSVHADSATGGVLDIDQTRQDSQHLVAGTKEGFMDIMQLVHYPDFDTYTVGHSVRVALLAVLVGHSMKLDDGMLLELCMAGLLHDVGKSQIPDEILFKPGQLDQDERLLMETHAQVGAEILMGHDKASPLAIAGAWGHHLRHDGGGYPSAPTWATRHFLTTLLQVCDVFEALTAIRPYKPPFSPRRVYEIMVSDKGAFDPAAFGIFVRSVGLYPPGSNIILSDGSRGTVTAAGVDPEKPCVLLTTDREGNSIPTAEQDVLDLGAEGEALPEVVEIGGY
ncbi:MAG: HD domain-containing protein [Gemmatimonadales bacterium]|nr:HD domain-containing protein [Gemmatimonadales bacterium]